MFLPVDVKQMLLFVFLPPPDTMVFEVEVPAEVTSKIAYIRFHGRNKEKWWQHEHAYERYDYTYSPDELEEWIPKIRKLDQTAEKTFVFANNHWRGQAVSTIRQLRMMLD